MNEVSRSRIRSLGLKPNERTVSGQKQGLEVVFEVVPGLKRWATVYLMGLITQRSQVQILPPLPTF